MWFHQIAIGAKKAEKWLTAKTLISRAVWSGCTLFANICVSKNLGSLYVHLGQNSHDLEK